MNKEELKCWFLDKFNSCYPVKHKHLKDKIFYYYDESYIRKSKLNKLNNQEVTLPTNVSGYCLFYQDSDKQFFYCDYNEIWNFFYYNYSILYDDIQLLIKSWLKEMDNLSAFTPKVDLSLYFNKLGEISNLSVYNK